MMQHTFQLNVMRPVMNGVELQWSNNRKDVESYHNYFVRRWLRQTLEDFSIKKAINETIVNPK